MLRIKNSEQQKQEKEEEKPVQNAQHKRKIVKGRFLCDPMPHTQKNKAGLDLDNLTMRPSEELKSRAFCIGWFRK